MKKFLAILLAVLSVMLIFASCGGGSEEPETNPSSSESTEIKEVFKGITSTDLEGNKVDDSVFKGKKITMVNMLLLKKFSMNCLNRP